MNPLIYDWLLMVHFRGSGYSIYSRYVHYMIAPRSCYEYDSLEYLKRCCPKFRGRGRQWGTQDLVMIVIPLSMVRGGSQAYMGIPLKDDRTVTNIVGHKVQYYAFLGRIEADSSNAIFTNIVQVS